MKVLVAGKGFIGEAVGEKLEGRHEVKYLDRGGADHEYDITEEFSIDEEFEVLIHTIGLAPGFSSAEEYREVHVEGTRNLLEAVDAERAVYMSALKAGEVDHSFFRTKREAEEILEGSSMEHAIIRPSTVYGRGNRLLDMMRRLAPSKIFPDIKTRTQPILLGDLVEMTVRLIEEEENGIFRAAGPEKMTVGELARHVYAEEGYSCLLVPGAQLSMEYSLAFLSFLPPPFEDENIKLMRHDNTTDENDAERFVDLRSIDGRRKA